MALLMMNGLSRYRIQNPTTDTRYAFNTVSNLNLQAGTIFDEANLRIGGGGSEELGIHVNHSTASNHIFASFWFFLTETNQDPLDWMKIWDYNTTQAAIKVRHGALELQRANTALIRTPNIIMHDQWGYCEWEYNISGSSGYMKARINGQLIADSLSDGKKRGWRGIANDRVTTIQWDNQSGGPSSHVSDFAVWDDTGSLNNSAKVSARTTRALSITGNGGFADFPLASSAGSTNWELIDENPANTLQWVGASSTGATDRFVIENLSTDVTKVDALQVTVLLTHPTGPMGQTYLQPFIESTGSEVTGLASGELNVGDGGALSEVSFFAEIDPATSAAWTVSGVNAARIGYRLVNVSAVNTAGSSTSW